MSAHIALFLAAILGAFCHWLKAKWQKEVHGNPVDYLIQHPWNTIAALGATMAAVGGAVMTGMADSMSIGTAAWLGFATGYAADNALNKGPGK